MLHKQGNALANGLLELGLKKGDTVATWLGNEVEIVAIQVAAAKAGLHVALLDYEMLDPKAIQTALKNSNAKAFFYDSKSAKYNSIVESAIPEVITGSPGNITSSLKYVFSAGSHTVPNAVLTMNQAVCYNPQPSPLSTVKVSSDDAYITSYSAFNKGKPDGKTLTQGDILKKATSLNLSLKMNSDDLVLISHKIASEFGVCVNFASWLTNTVVSFLEVD